MRVPIRTPMVQQTRLLSVTARCNTPQQHSAPLSARTPCRATAPTATSGRAQTQQLGTLLSPQTPPATTTMQWARVLLAATPPALATTRRDTQRLPQTLLV